MDINELLEAVDVGKFVASIKDDLIMGTLLDTIYFALKPSIIKAIKEATVKVG